MEFPTETGFTKETQELTVEAVVLTDIEEYNVVYYFKRFEVAALEHDSGYIRGSIPPALFEILERSAVDVEAAFRKQSQTELLTLYRYSDRLYYPLNNSQTNRQAQKYVIDGELITKEDSYTKFSDPDAKMDVLSFRGDQYVIEREMLDDGIESGEVTPVIPLVSAET